MAKSVKIVEVASLANRNIFYQFMYIFFCLFAFSRPNTSIKFRLANGSKTPLTNLPLPLKLNT